MHLPLPFAIEAALGQENQVVDSLSDWTDGPYLEDTWHRLTGGDSIQRVLRQRRDVVSDEDAPLVGGPLQNGRVICGIEKEDTSRFVFLYLVNRRIPVDFRQFLIRHHNLFLNLHRWTVRLLVPRRFKKSVALYKAALREELWTPLNPSVSKVLETYFRQRKEQGGHLGRAAKAIQDKLNRLDEAFLFERSIDIETYDRHAEKLREELTLARIDRHSGQLDELDVEGIRRSQNGFYRAPPISGCRRHSNSASGSNNCSFPTESRSTEKALLEPA